MPSCATVIYLIALTTIIPTFGQLETTTKFTLTRTRTNKPKSCTTRNGKEGICVDKSTCSDKHEIEEFGRIIESELRSSSDCNVKIGEWCCSRKDDSKGGDGTPIPPVVTTVTPIRSVITTNTPTPAVVTTKTPTPAVVTTKIPTPAVVTTLTPIPAVVTTETPKIDPNCYASDQEEAPWIAKLYRKGQDYPYCVGTVIGSNAILTTGTCMIQAHDTFVWAQILGSENPEANYTIISKIIHPNYKSGTRLNDLALFSTLSGIVWGPGGQKGACIDSQMSLPGNNDCKAAVLSFYDELEMVPVSITNGACTERANVADALCGTGLFPDVFDGTPIVCPKNNRNVLAGITKSSYPSNNYQILLGSLDYSWLTKTLKSEIDLKETDFIYKLNY